MSKRRLYERLRLDDLLEHRPDLVLDVLEARFEDDPRILELLGEPCPWLDDGEPEEERPPVAGPRGSVPKGQSKPAAKALPEFSGPQAAVHRWQTITPLRCPWPWQFEFSELAWRKYWAYAWADQDKEISGFGLLDYDSPPVPNQPWHARVVDLWYLSSFDTGTSSVIPAEAQAQLQIRLLREGRDLSKLRLWWHSHHRMSPFWSATDVRAIGEMMDAQAALGGSDEGWMVSSVCAFPRRMLVRADFWRRGGPHLDGVAIDEVPTFGPDGRLVEIECLQEVSEGRRLNWRAWDAPPFRVAEDVPRLGGIGPALQPALLPGMAPMAESARNAGGEAATSCRHGRRIDCQHCWADHTGQRHSVLSEPDTARNDGCLYCQRAAVPA